MRSWKQDLGWTRSLLEHCVTRLPSAPLLHCSQAAANRSRRSARRADAVRRELLNVETIVSPAFRKNAKVIGNGEIAWRGTDIRAVLEEIVRSGAAILGMESVIFRSALSGPMVEAISDSSRVLERWRNAEPWKWYVQRTLRQSIFDIERNLSNPYGEDIWYIVVASMPW